MDLDSYVNQTDLPAFQGGDLDEHIRRVARIGAYAGAAWATAHCPAIIHINQVCDHDTPPAEPVVEVQTDGTEREVMQDVMNEPGGIAASHF